MFIVNIAGFASLVCLLSQRYKEKINTVLQPALGIWMLLLYGLAFFQRLSWIDGISVLFILAFAFYLWKKHLPVKDTVKGLADSPAILFAMSVLIISFLVKDKIVVHSDELGVWGPEPKSLYMLDGFADKYTNLLFGYSAYHPGAMLIEWWTCHFSPNQFYEGLLYVGIWFIFLCSAAPIFANLRIKRRFAVLLSIPVSAILILLPSMYGVMNYYLIAEMPMSMVFAGCMFSCFDRENHSKQFQFLRFTVSLAFLMMIKESGIIFAVFILLFYFILEGVRKNGEWNFPTITYGLGSFAIALVPMLIWRVYCTVYERSNYFASAFDSTLSNIKSQTFTLQEDLPGYASSMLKAWIQKPLHGAATAGLDLTPLTAALLVLFLCWYCAKIHILKKPSAIRFGVLYVAFVLVYMIILLFMHAYIFGEEAYLDPGVMVYSVGRYGEPLFEGTFVYFTALILREKAGRTLQIKRWLVAAVFIFTCCNLQLTMNSVIDYTDLNAQAYEARTTVMELEPVTAFVGEVDDHLTEKDPARILWVSDREDIVATNGLSRVLGHLVAPKAYAYYQVDASSRNTGDLAEAIKNQIKQLHFGYIYFDFSDSEEWEMAGTPIQNRTLYRVTLQDGENLCLENMPDSN